MKASQISCEEVIDHLFEYLDRELDEQNQQVIDDHLKRCFDCFSRAEFERRLRQRIAATGVEAAPTRLKQRIWELTGQ
ncbi:anti-sigma factor family protein [Marinobacter sp.]|jgi:anti-sigma factor (TIGR02949 family)|uniref:anti-sigma factor family protein n=1 Tax=Marinobacter sp. TaxID=50741 RepID=UPI000C5AF25D|nr:zf-HC2 domain-containing protein [Marinobacter sp.]MAO13880.1 anti-sigma factor [Marinobacter sp.]|tara:strand:+ start:1246 stop:1479 length:234 start_codon:yes stop_codon:yes gene_type:complete